MSLIVPDSIDSITKEIATPVAKKIGTTLADIWEIVFGGIGYAKQKHELQRQESYRKFKEGLVKKMDEIPEEKLVMPDVQIVGGALQDSRFCIDKDELREMFENLIASSMNADTCESVHPSFSDIIRRMSPQDAKNFMLWCKSDRRAIVNYQYTLKSGGDFPLLLNVIDAYSSVDDARSQSRSFECLSALGLIELDYSHHLADDNLYKPFFEGSLFHFAELCLKSPDTAAIAVGIHVEKGLSALTEYGKQFADVCT